eukprot:354212-Chlamydomonas_euryale.AAC.18
MSHTCSLLRAWAKTKRVDPEQRYRGRIFWRIAVWASAALLRQHRPSPSLRCTGDQRPNRPTAAAAPQRPQHLSALGHRHGQAAERHLAPDGSDVRSDGGALADAHPQSSTNHA